MLNGESNCNCFGLHPSDKCAQLFIVKDYAVYWPLFTIFTTSKKYTTFCHVIHFAMYRNANVKIKKINRSINYRWFGCRYDCFTSM